MNESRGTEQLLASLSTCDRILLNVGHSLNFMQWVIQLEHIPHEFLRFSIYHGSLCCFIELLV